MSDHIAIEELSAYLDGEALDGVAVESHMHTCDACRQQMVSLQALGKSLQELSGPEVHPAFATRVRASIEAEEKSALPSGMRRWVMSMSGLAAAALITVAVVSQDSTSPTTPSTSTGATYAGLDQIDDILKQDEADLASQLESSLSREWVASAIVSAAYQVAEPETEGHESDILAAALSETEPEALLDTLWLGKTDSRTEIHRLTPQQSDLFKQMLVTHAREELLGDGAFEG